MAVFKMNTTTFCGWFQTNPQRRWDLQEKYYCMWNSSRGFWKTPILTLIHPIMWETTGMIL
ncbi:hypothetical protein DWV51_12520 [Faecalibacterium prausnitzii]|nr:hypothetical protein DWV51_12520 [Faecalibacterium prausnitzii]